MQMESEVLQDQGSLPDRSRGMPEERKSEEEKTLRSEKGQDQGSEGRDERIKNLKKETRDGKGRVVEETQSKAD